MQKFTIFSALLTIIVIIVVAQIVVNDYLPDYKKDAGDTVFDVFVPDSLDLAKATQDNVLGTNNLTNKLGPDNSPAIDESEMVVRNEADNESAGTVVELPDLNYSPPVILEDSDDESVGADIFTNQGFVEDTDDENDVEDFEDFINSSLSASVYLNDEQIRNSGFVSAYKEEEAHDGYLYKTVYIDDLPEVTFSKYAVRDQSRLFAKVYIISPETDNVSSVYKSIKNRADKTLNSSINQTDEFGNASFYMNDSTRSQIAFLTVRIGPSIYGFSYPKEYHPQIKNLIKSLELSR